MTDKLIQTGYDYAKELYAAKGVDIDKAMEETAKIAVSMHCWQGDDVIGCEGDVDGLTGGIATTGNYPGRARNAEELRSDIDKALTFIPGKKKLNLHASYAELHGKKIDRDAYTAEEFKGWIDWAKGKKMGMDFNPTYFSHERAADGFTLASSNEGNRKFWIEHGKRCREIGEVFAKELGETCVINFWMCDGYKDLVADTDAPRKRMVDSLDQIFAAKKIDKQYVLDAVESKLFGFGVEAYTVGSHELMLSYALTRGIMYALDAGHFHPTEVISAKISAVMQFMPQILLHVSRPIRWDSDHVVVWDDELQAIMNEIVRNDYTKRVNIALDYFDASINRVAAWVIGMRNTQKALLHAFVEPTAAMKQAEYAQDYTTRLALLEESKTLPFGSVWDAYCAKQNVAVGDQWLADVKKYEKDVLSKR